MTNTSQASHGAYLPSAVENTNTANYLSMRHAITVYVLPAKKMTTGMLAAWCLCCCLMGASRLHRLTDCQVLTKHTCLAWIFMHSTCTTGHHAAAYHSGATSLM